MAVVIPGIEVHPGIDTSRIVAQCLFNNAYRFCEISPLRFAH